MTQIDMFPETLIGQTQLSAAATHAKPFQSQANKKAGKILEQSGRGCINLLHSKDPSLPFLKTLLVTLPWASIRSSMIWKVKTTPSQRLLFQLVSLRPTSESDSGLLHTPSATANQMSPSMSKSGWWPTPRARDFFPPVNHTSVSKNNQGYSTTRQKTKVKYGASLPDAVNYEHKMWPTPTANEDAAGTPKGKMQKMLGNHPEVRGKTPEEWQKGSLNPEWVTWLMGYPRGWTDLEDTTDLK